MTKDFTKQELVDIRKCIALTISQMTLENKADLKRLLDLDDKIEAYAKLD